MKVYVVLERGDCHGVFESQALAELLAREISAEVFEAELNLMVQSHLALVEERLKHRIEEAQKKAAADIKMLSLIRGNI